MWSATAIWLGHEIFASVATVMCHSDKIAESFSTNIVVEGLVPRMLWIRVSSEQ